MGTLGRASLAQDDLLDYRCAASSPLCPRSEATEGDLAFRFKQGTMTAVEPTQVSIGE